MKLYDSVGKMSKINIYDIYTRIVYDFKNYDNVSRKQMIKEIVDAYHEDHFMYGICTKRELDFITKFYNKKITKDDLDKYSWEIGELDYKYIFDASSLSFYEDYNDIIPNLIERNKKQPKDEFPLSMFVVSSVKIYGEVLVKALESLCRGMFDIGNIDFNNYLNHPLIHFYCSLSSVDLEIGNEIAIYHNDYDLFIDELREQRKKLGVAGTIGIDLQLYKDFYYYGCNYSNPVVKKMYDKIDNDSDALVTKFIVDRCRLLGESYDYEEYNDIINDALYEMPSGAMNGVSPRQRDEILLENEDLKEKFSCVPQNNAHVHKDVADKFYYYYFALLEYVNNKYHVSKNINKIFKQNYLDPNEITKIENYLWEHKKEIDEFIKDNPFNFNDTDMGYIKQFKTGLKDDRYVFVGTDKEYARFLSMNGKVYMVKGLRADIDKILDTTSVPFMVKTHLLFFEGYIIFTGLFNLFDIEMGNDFKQTVLKEVNNSLEYYHF